MKAACNFCHLRCFSILQQSLPCHGINNICRRVDCLRIFVSLDIDALGGDVIPGSPCSVRSSGDGSSCDTPPVHDSASSTEDGRTERGKYCDCCYCEFFGHAAVSNATV